jgi:hypothetical protein
MHPRPRPPAQFAFPLGRRRGKAYEPPGVGVHARIHAKDARHPKLFLRILECLFDHDKRACGFQPFLARECQESDPDGNKYHY